MSEPLYRNVTRSIPVGELPAELRNALHTHANHKKLGLIAAQAWVTRRESMSSPGLFSRVLHRSFGLGAKQIDAWQEMAFVLHATHILLAAHGQLRPSHVDIFSLPLAKATFTKSDDGFDIGGFAPAQGAADHFMALGAGADAEACMSATTSAIASAKIPTA